MVQMYLSVVCGNIQGQHFNLATGLGGEVFLYNIDYAWLNIQQPICVRVLKGYADTVQVWLDLSLIDQPINFNQSYSKEWILIHVHWGPTQFKPLEETEKNPNTEMSPVN